MSYSIITSKNHVIFHRRLAILDFGLMTSITVAWSQMTPEGGSPGSWESSRIDTPGVAFRIPNFDG